MDLVARETGFPKFSRQGVGQLVPLLRHAARSPSMRAGPPERRRPWPMRPRLFTAEFVVEMGAEAIARLLDDCYYDLVRAESRREGP